jgi:hypothetical protein
MAWAAVLALPVLAMRPVLPDSMSRPRAWNPTQPERSGQGSAARNKGTPQMPQIKEQENTRRVCAEVISSRGEAVRVRMVDPLRWLFAKYLSCRSSLWLLFLWL